MRSVVVVALNAETDRRAGVPRKCLLDGGYLGYNGRSSRDQAGSDNLRGLAGAVRAGGLVGS